MIKVLFFAGIREKMDRESVNVNAANGTVNNLKQMLIEQYPEIADDVSRSMIAVNEEFVAEDTVLQENDVVAIIPPVSGG